MNDIIKRLKNSPKEKVLKLRDNYQRFFAIFPKLKEGIDLRAFYQSFVNDSLIHELAKVIMYVKKNEKNILSKSKLINIKKKKKNSKRSYRIISYLPLPASAIPCTSWTDASSPMPNVKTRVVSACEG
jgi:hypothetical protein